MIPKFKNGSGLCVTCGKICDWRAQRCKSCSIRERHKTRTLGFYRIKTDLLFNEKTFFSCVGSHGYKGGKGYEGSYKGHKFRYEMRLPEGLVRHHIIYDDSNPNLGLVFVTKKAHNLIHIFKAKIREGTYHGN